MGRRRAYAMGLLLLVSVGSCGPGPQPKGFTVHYETGSIPPPGNHNYQLTGRFEDDRIAVSYALTYRYRDMLAPGEGAKLGYSDRDDIAWTGTINGQGVEQWRSLLRAVRLSSAPTLLPGGDSFLVTIRYDRGPEQTGVPGDRDTWEALVAAIDRQARAETHNPRPYP